MGRTHRVDLDWFIERIKLDPGITMKYVGTDEQLADMLAKGSFTVAKWKSRVNIHQIGDNEKLLSGGQPTYTPNPVAGTQNKTDLAEKEKYKSC